MKIEINTYQKLWKYENKMYKLGNVNMPFPINVYDVMYFVIAFGTMIALGKLSIVHAIPSMLRLGVIPYLVAKYLRHVKFDGKTPILFIRDIIPYFFTCRQKYQFFQKVTREFSGQKVKLNWQIGARAWGGY